MLERATPWRWLEITWLCLRRVLDEAQDYGVRVHLWGVATADDEYNQSQSLIAEADQRWILSEEWIRRFISKAVPQEAVLSPLQVSPGHMARLAAKRVEVSSIGNPPPQAAMNLPLLQERTDEEQAQEDKEADTIVVQDDPVKIGLAFGTRWVSRATSPEWATLIALHLPIPPALDSELMDYAIRCGANVWDNKDARWAVRGAFWQTVLFEKLTDG